MMKPDLSFVFLTVFEWIYVKGKLLYKKASYFLRKRKIISILFLNYPTRISFCQVFYIMAF